jgi:hypothetical protein
MGIPRNGIDIQANWRYQETVVVFRPYGDTSRIFFMTPYGDFRNK